MSDTTRGEIRLDRSAMKLSNPESQEDELTNQVSKHAGKYRKKVVGSQTVRNARDLRNSSAGLDPWLLGPRRII